MIALFQSQWEWSAGLTYFRYPRGTIDLFGKNFSLALGVEMKVAVGSLVAELIHSYVFPHIHALDKMSEPVSAILAGASNSVGAISIYTFKSKDSK